MSHHTMIIHQILLVLLLTTISSSFAFTTTAITSPRAFTTPRTSGIVYAQGDEDTGGPAIAKPKVGVKVETVTTEKTKTINKQKVKSADPIHRREDKFEDAPLYRLMLIGDEEYDQSHVVERMCEILSEMDEGNAASVFTQAQQGGKAMCGKYPFEIAELYKEQLVRSDPLIYSDVEEDRKGK